jgi:hypothetical protein
MGRQGRAYSSTSVPVPEKQMREFFRQFSKDSRGIVKIDDMQDSTYVLVSITDKDGENAIIGYCYNIGAFLPYRIEFDQKSWDASSELGRWGLAYHELGHCVCGREHTIEHGSDDFMNTMIKWGIPISAKHRERFADGCPNSLMNYYLPDDMCLAFHHDEYVRELFSRCKVPLRLGPKKQ